MKTVTATPSQHRAFVAIWGGICSGDGRMERGSVGSARAFT